MRMHFRTSVAAALLLLPVALMAQPKKVRFGVLLGGSSSSVSDVQQAFIGVSTNLIKVNRRIGGDVGAFVQVPFTSMLSVQAETHFAQKGLKLSGNFGDLGGGASATGDIGLHLNYVEVPILFRVDIGSSTSKVSVRPMFLAGGSAAFRVSCKVKFSVRVQGFQLNDETNCTEGNDNGDPFTKNDFSLIGGGGVAVTVPGVTFTVQARYTQGLTNISKNNTDNNGTTNRNNAFTLLFGIGF